MTKSRSVACLDLKPSFQSSKPERLANICAVRSMSYVVTEQCAQLTLDEAA